MTEILERMSTTWKLANPRELWETEKQTNSWLDFMLSEGSAKQQYGSELEAIASHASHIVEQAARNIDARAFNVVDLGCGDGWKGVFFAARIELTGGFTVRYVPIDLNPVFIRHAVATAENMAKGVAPGLVVITTKPQDFFTADYSGYKSPHAPNNLYTIFGNLFYPSDDVLQLLRRIVTATDAAVVGTELLPKNVHDMLERYKTNGKVEAWFFHAAERLGFERSDLAFNPQFSYATGRVEWSYDVLAVPKAVREKTAVETGDRLVMAHSLRPTERQLAELLGQYFNVKIYTSRDKGAALAFVQK